VPTGYLQQDTDSELGRQVAVDFESDADFHECGSCPVHSRLPTSLVATALLARDHATIVPFDRCGHHAAISPWANGDTTRADSDGDV
jgi:hypothetical protein